MASLARADVRPGLPGVLLRAKKDGKIHAVQPEVEALRSRARFFLSPRVEQKIMKMAGE